MRGNIYAKLSAVQKALFVPKGNRNQFGGYNYRSCEDILRAVKPLLQANGLVLTMSSKTELIGTWMYVNVTCKLRDAENETTEVIEVSSQAREPEMRKGMDAAQVSGSSLSYARKYALAGLFGIDNERDPDATNDHGKGESGNATVAIDPNTCPLKDPRFYGKKWGEIGTENLKKLASLPSDFKSLTEAHRTAIKAILDERTADDATSEAERS